MWLIRFIAFTLLLFANFFPFTFPDYKPEASVLHRPPQPITGRYPALPEGLPAVGGTLPGHRPQLHVRLRSGAERRRGTPESVRSARWRAAALPHQEDEQVLLPGLEQRRGSWVCGVTGADEAGAFAPLTRSGVETFQGWTFRGSRLTVDLSQPAIRRLHPLPETDPQMRSFLAEMRHFNKEQMAEQTAPRQ